MFTVEQIELAHSKVKSGADFPSYIKEIAKLGVTGFVTFVFDSHTVYSGNGDFQTQSEPQYESLSIDEICNKKQFVHFLKIHQRGETDYYTFCKQCAEVGIEKWVVRIEAMTCTYFDRSGNEILVEKIPD